MLQRSHQLQPPAWPHTDMAGSGVSTCWILVLLIVAHAGYPVQTEDVCHVQVDRGKTTYKIPVQRPLDECDCESWINGTGYTIAICVSMDEPWVLNRTKTSLTTSKCFDKITYKLTCDDKDFIVDCVVNCTEPRSPVSVNNNNTEGHFYLILAVIVLCVVITVLVVAFLRCRKNKKQETTVDFPL